ncbi:esterase family protein [Penicillium sp. DV-2018c]|nr:esterase family protein [Penicillium sp. DV-2018c]
MKTGTLLSSLFLTGTFYAWSAYGLPNDTSPNIAPRRQLPRGPGNFYWVKKWAAVGDSYTAGIGSGNPLGKAFLTFAGDEDYQCSRYDTSYPMILKDSLGSAGFHFAACSGDRTGNIYQQIQSLDGDLDLVVMTAGGNDLCLSTLILKCVFSPYNEDSCNDVLDIAQDNLDQIMEDNFKLLLDALDDKMAKDSIVVFNGYAQFFNTENEDCAENEDWTLWTPPNNPTPMTMTVKRRKRFNDLVVQLNDIIRKVVNDARKSDKYKYKIGFSNWDPWPSKYVRGQYCDPSSSGSYPDDDVPDLQFFKPDTHPFLGTTGDGMVKVADRNETERLKARMQESDEMLAQSASFRRTRNPLHLVHRRLAGDGPAPANCPGDKEGELQESGGGWIPDDIGKNFHPNELGHYTIASWALQTAIDVRAEWLDYDPPSCEMVDEFECYGSDDSRRAYASEPRLNEKLKDFCDDVKDNHPDEDGWSWSKKYDEGTPDETEFKMQLEDTTDSFNHDTCVESMQRIVNGCDGNDPNNPMDWKFGGSWRRGDHTYIVTPQRDNRPWPKDGGPIQKPYGKCDGGYKVFFSTYTIYGAGWASWDYGQDTFLGAAKDCVGGGISDWDFEYFDEPDDDGYEWKVTFKTPIWVNARCFDNNKVVEEAGGFTDGCSGTG